MAYRALRSTTSFFRLSFTAPKLRHSSLLTLSCLQSTNDEQYSSISRDYFQPVRNYINVSVDTSATPNSPLRGQLSLRTLNTTAALWTTGTAAKQSTETPSGNAGLDSSSSSESSDSNSDSGDDSSSNDEGGEGFDSVDSIRLAVLDASLDFVAEHGWSAEAIAAGAETLGYSSMTHGLVDGGGGELFTHLQRRLNEKLEVELERMSLEGEEHPHSKLSKTQFIEAGLKHRLSLIVPYLSVWSRGLVMASMSPSTAKQGLNNVAILADHICYYSGDTSVNSSWYTKRAAVAVVYKAAELSLLQDKSPDYEETWQFLQRRVQEMVSLEKNLNSLDEVAVEATKVGRAALNTSLNMLGMNTKSR